MADNDVINDLLGGIGFSIKKAVSKVKEGATKATATYQQMSPQMQAIRTGMQQFKGKSKGTPSSSTIPTTKSSYKTGNMFSKLMKKKIYGIPVLFVGLSGFFVGFPLLKKLGKR